MTNDIVQRYLWLSMWDCRTGERERASYTHDDSLANVLLFCLRPELYRRMSKAVAPAHALAGCR